MGKRQPYKSMRRVRYSVGSDPGALAAFDVAVSTLLPAADAKYRIMSLEYQATWEPAALIDGSMVFGVAHGDYTAGEVEEALEATTSINQGLLVERERANRLIRILGTIQGNVDTVGDVSLNDHGKLKKVKLNWEIPIGKTLNSFFFNQSGVVWTTGGTFGSVGKANIIYT